MPASTENRGATTGKPALGEGEGVRATIGSRSAGIDEGRHAVRAHFQAGASDGKWDDVAAQPCELGLDCRLGAGLDQKHDAAASARPADLGGRSEEHTSELQSHSDLVCRLLL